jgi:pilus assembly protein Flp/PilA
MMNFLFTLQSVIAGRSERDDKGATAVEYGLMVALIAVAIIAGVTLLGTELSDLFKAIGNKLNAITVT